MDNSKKGGWVDLVLFISPKWGQGAGVPKPEKFAYVI